jgi:hypothetical protein
MYRILGMFLYVKLVLFVIMAQDNLSDVQKEVETLPNGLGQAYALVKPPPFFYDGKLTAFKL